SAEIVNPPHDASTVRFGSKVTLNAQGRRQIFRIVGEDEADPKHGLLSYVAPLARELIGKEPGETVSTPAGEAEIIAIEICSRSKAPPCRRPSARASDAHRPRSPPRGRGLRSAHALSSPDRHSFSRAVPARSTASPRGRP